MAYDHQVKRASPMGYRFHPTNQELMKYLLGFVRDEPLPEQYKFMQLIDLYADKDPWHIFEGNDNSARYFITPQKKEKPTWKKISRTVGNGTWKSQNKGKIVLDDKGRVMGYVKSLKYIPSKQSSNNANGEWLMKEYSLCDGKEIKKKGFVICNIKKKKKEKPGDKMKEVVNMIDVEEFIDSVLQENNGIVSNNVVGDQVAMLGYDVHQHNVQQYINSSDNGITKDEDKIQHLEGEHHSLEHSKLYQFLFYN